MASPAITITITLGRAITKGTTRVNDYFSNVHCTGRVRTWEHHLEEEGATVQTLRYWDYYGMTETFTDLYDSANKGESFRFLYDIITSRENILLAYRTIKNNKGSKTPGTVLVQKLQDNGNESLNLGHTDTITLKKGRD